MESSSPGVRGMQGNKWTCPESGRIGVAASMDEVSLGDLFCSDGQGPSGATSRHAVIDMLVIDRSIYPSSPDQARLPSKHILGDKKLSSRGKTTRLPCGRASQSMHSCCT